MRPMTPPPMIVSRPATSTYPRALSSALLLGRYRSARTGHLAHRDPAAVGGRPLDRLADRLRGGALVEPGRPRRLGPALEKVGDLIGERGAVPDALADRPPLGGVGGAGVLGAD